MLNFPTRFQLICYFLSKVQWNAKLFVETLYPRVSNVVFLTVTETKPLRIAVCHPSLPEPKWHQSTMPSQPPSKAISLDNHHLTPKKSIRDRCLYSYIHGVDKGRAPINSRKINGFHYICYFTPVSGVISGPYL